MRDYARMVEILRNCAKDSCETCPIGGAEYTAKDCRKAHIDAADVIEELQSQIAEVGKMVNELIAYAQKEADEWRTSQNASYGDDRSVSVYTWANNAKCTHERYVAKLDDIAAKLPDSGYELYWKPKEDAEC